MVDIERLRALMVAATPGKWYVVESPWGEGDWLVAGSPDPHGRTFVADTDDPSFEEGDRDEDEIARYRPLENAALIAAAVNDLPALLDELEAARLAISEAALEAARVKLAELRSDLADEDRADAEAPSADR